MCDIPTTACGRSQHRVGKAGTGMRERIRSPGLAGQESWLAMTVPYSQLWFVSPMQERDEALDDLTGPEPQNQVRFIYIQTCG